MQRILFVKFLRASWRGIPEATSWDNLINSCPIVGENALNSRPTRSIALSRPNPASTQTESISMASGKFLLKSFSLALISFFILISGNLYIKYIAIQLTQSTI